MKVFILSQDVDLGVSIEGVFADETIAQGKADDENKKAAHTWVGGDGNTYHSSPSWRVETHDVQGDDVKRQAADLVGQAVWEIDQIVDARNQSYADAEAYSPKHAWHEKRKFTLKDAKPKAKRAADILRDAWELLDPRQPGITQIKKD